MVGGGRGGVLGAECYVSSGFATACQDLWWLDGATWRQIDPRAMLALPPLNSDGIVAWDPSGGDLHYLGADAAQKTMTDGVLALRYPAPPAIETTFDFARSGIERARVDKAWVTVYAGAQGEPLVPASAGAALWVWTWGARLDEETAAGVGGRWVRVIANTAADDASSTVAASLLDWEAMHAEQARALLGGNGLLHVQVRPAGTATFGVGGENPSVGLDYAEVRLRYLLD